MLKIVNKSIFLIWGILGLVNFGMVLISIKIELIVNIKLLINVLSNEKCL